jgi:hypothetical protein
MSDEMKIITEQDGIYIARAMGYVPVEVMKDLVPSPKDFEKPRIQRRIRFNDMFTIITRWEREEKGWDLCQNGILHPERINQRDNYVYITLDVIEASVEGVEEILEEVTGYLDFHYKAYESKVVKRNERDMKHAVKNISGTIEQMIREEMMESEWDRRYKQAKKN